MKKRTSYHHGDLKAALVDTAIELIRERGIRNFSLSEVSRRLEVTVAAPYRHFADRDDLLAAVALRGYEICAAHLATEMQDTTTPTDQLTAVARGWVRFAYTERPFFEALFSAGLDKSHYPDLEQAAADLREVVVRPARELCDGDDVAAHHLALAVVAQAFGAATTMLNALFGDPEKTIEVLVEHAALVARALVEGRQALFGGGGQGSSSKTVHLF